MRVVDWLLESDPSIRWRAMRDVTGAPAEEVAGERSLVAREGRGAQILAAQDADGRWDGGTFLPKWVATADTLHLLDVLRPDPADPAVQRAIAPVHEAARWAGRWDPS